MAETSKNPRDVPRPHDGRGGGTGIPGGRRQGQNPNPCPKDGPGYGQGSGQGGGKNR